MTLVSDDFVIFFRALSRMLFSLIVFCWTWQAKLCFPGQGLNPSFAQRLQKYHCIIIVHVLCCWMDLKCFLWLIPHLCPGGEESLDIEPLRKVFKLACENGKWVVTALHERHALRRLPTECHDGSSWGGSVMFDPDSEREPQPVGFELAFDDCIGVSDEQDSSCKWPLVQVRASSAFFVHRQWDH